ncbi:MAG TPA: type II toxin-antitoxin system RelE/ParE family toxin [Terriglobales bacterium]|jgi:plasmid stabilization system protein ParE|nr:type II toxin-antitoxin system RelE/ParE family toxin [Terriglobales bacterium]
MTSFQFTSQALADLVDIWSFIAKDNPAAADRVEDAIFSACELLAREPLIGRERHDLTELPVRFWVLQPYSNYLIVYRPEKKPLQVVRILHAARDLPQTLR